MKKKQRDSNKIPTIGDVEEIVGELLSDALQVWIKRGELPAKACVKTF